MSKLMVPLSSLTPEKQRAWARKQMAKIEAMAKAERELKQRRLEWANDPRRRDEKPMLIVHQAGDRPIVVVGAGQHYRQELKEIAMKRAEAPMFRNGRRNVQPNPFETLRTAADMRVRESIGLKVFHIKNNPLGKDYA